MYAGQQNIGWRYFLKYLLSFEEAVTHETSSPGTFFVSLQGAAGLLLFSAVADRPKWLPILIYRMFG